MDRLDVGGAHFKEPSVWPLWRLKAIQKAMREADSLLSTGRCSDLQEDASCTDEARDPSSKSGCYKPAENWRPEKDEHVR